jgi:hypothetical protein
LGKKGGLCHEKNKFSHTADNSDNLGFTVCYLLFQCPGIGSDACPDKG